MERFVDAIKALEPWQRWVLVALAAIVAVMIVVVATVGGSEPDETMAAPSTASTTTAAPTTTTTTTTTSEPTTTTSTSTSTTTSTTTTTAPPPPESIFTLRPDGLGDELFGDDADGVIATLSEVLGTPDEDTGWVPTLETYATCIGAEIRFVTWRSLRAFFTDGPSDWAPGGVRHFAAFDHSEAIGTPLLELTTADGVGIGSPVGDVRAIYGESAVIEDDPLFGDLFQVDAPGAGFLWGQLSGSGATDTVLSLSGGVSCGE